MFQSRGKELVKPNWDVAAFTAECPPRADPRPGVGQAGSPSLSCAVLPGALLGGRLRAHAPWDRLSLGLASHGGVSKRKLVFCLPFSPAELCSSDRNGGALARGKTAPGEKALLFISDSGVPAAPCWFSPRVRAPRAVPWLEVFDPLRQMERFGAVAAQSIPWACSSPFPRKSRWKSESLVQPIHTPPCSSAGSQK